ncbi:MAG TPA: ribosome-binding factor A [bacterium]|nr:ribosome-binding factor A [bacterium]
MSRMEQVNATLQQELAFLVAEHIHLKGGLVTIVWVDCTRDLREATIAVSVLPEKFAGTVLGQLRQKSGIFASQLRKRIRMKRLPSFRWELDTTESNAAVLEDIFQTL